VSTVREFLLAGGSGFIGSHVARGLMSRGHHVTVLSRGQRSAIPRATMVAADRRDPDGVARALAGRRFDLTVDFLAYDEPDLEWLTRVPRGALGRCVMISTGQVYLVGEGAEPPFVEDDALRPIRPEPATGEYDRGSWGYGVGKRRAEQALLRMSESHGVRGVAIRLPIVQGEGDGSLRLWGYLQRMLDGGPIVLPEGGRRRVRHLLASDLAAIIGRLADGPPPRHFAYNLAQPDIVTLRALLEDAARAADVRPRFVDAPWEACRAAGLDERFSPYAGRWSSLLDPARATQELGFAGTASPDYLPRLVRWHLEHRPSASHDGYAQRERELAMATDLAASPARTAGAARRTGADAKGGFLDPSGSGG
jgi:nucleoside-diphosphate-sugar epimerase